MDRYVYLGDDGKLQGFLYGMDVRPNKNAVRVSRDEFTRLTGVETEEATGPSSIYTELELAQQEITDLQLADMEQGQAVTDLEIMILEGKRDV